ncbi:hypothetical protein EUBHAL_00293 [Anaerobutyricum hallii DSM 3353]|uniref:Uncharacterized protein n=1 Tax=Anaerobutyricum hallii DSM 3353 TaxID=411469 RepID=C0ESC2_9FIRM|nr:hypothetical protein EUBHAL_00293 [Anaerobutyricum hallii DSM 3353]
MTEVLTVNKTGVRQLLFNIRSLSISNIVFAVYYNICLSSC